MTSTTRRYLPRKWEDSDSKCGSGRGSPAQVDNSSSSSGWKDFAEVDIRSTDTASTSQIHLYVISLIFLLSSFTLFLSLITAHTNNSLLSSLEPYTIDLGNGTNTTWGYGSMPLSFPSLKSDHDNGESEDDSKLDVTETETALDPEDTSILFKNLWSLPDGSLPEVSIFPITTDTIDETRPDEVVTFDTNFLVKKHVSLPYVFP